MPFRSRSSLTSAFDPSKSAATDDAPVSPTCGKPDPHTATTTPLQTPAVHSGPGLPPPVLQSSLRRGAADKAQQQQKKSARVNGGLRVHWDRFKRKMGSGTAPSTSSAFEPEESIGDSSSGFPRSRHGGGAHVDDTDELVDEVVVDREWSDEIKSSSGTHSEHGGSPEKSGGSNHLGGTNTDRESLAIHPIGFWGLSPVLVFLRWRLWSTAVSFFSTRFMDERSEQHYKKENWFMRKNLALWSAVFYIINWVLAIAFVPKPLVLPDKLFYYGITPALSFPILPMVMYDWPRDRHMMYQCFLVVSTWSWSIYPIISMYLCGFYLGSPHVLYSCGGKDFLTTFYYSSALQTIALFGLKLHRFAAMAGAVIFFAVEVGLIIPIHSAFTRNVMNFVFFQGFLLYVHYMRENAERRLYTLRDQLKIQFRATQKAQVNERKAADSKRRLTSYVFHEVRVPLNTALLAVQNMDASGLVAKSQDIEFKALEGSLSMMSKVLNDVLDFNRMDSGRFESVLKPYAFHQVMRSMFVPLQLATDARGLQFVIDLDKNIDEIARRALYEAMGESEAVINQRMREQPEEDGIVVGDESRLRQIITNLASNACKFTPTGGKLLVTTRLVLPNWPANGNHSSGTCDTWAESKEGREFSQKNGAAELPTRTGAGGELAPAMPHRLSATHLTQHNVIHSKPAPPLEWIVVRIEVTDTGCGIRPKDMVQSKLFSAFNQTEQGRLQGGKGTGLGLALVRQIVKLSGGRLGVRSKVNEGSTFWVELPLGVGSKALPALNAAAEQRLFDNDDAPLTFSRYSRNARNDTPGTKSVTLVDTPEMRMPANLPTTLSSSALHSIMEQGGLVEISTRRGEQSPPTRSIGDPSTGTDLVETSPVVTSDALGFERPAPPTERSSDTIRLHLSQLPKPASFHIDGAPSSPTTSTGSTLQTQAAANTSGPQESPLRVLVVDDDPLTRKLMSRMLTRLGCRVMTAENGEIALDLILGTGQRATPSSEDTGSGGLSFDGSASGDEYRFAVIFLDNQMPVLSGLDVVLKLRDMGRHDFVVGVTGNALLTDQQEYLEAGADHVLTKPVLEKSLRRMLLIADERRRRPPGTTPSSEQQPPAPQQSQEPVQPQPHAPHSPPPQQLSQPRTSTS
ncbi:hypothetical protein OBBRIDRAFT_762246 [Obba rivulosa]|uniref:histidine kinase n=1 Tax=Obba rivulosa TaxID=1052685 RepID=A0A8E2APA6_9APHY|nr:hypothetical protein OBBRIDRAFT_762246 [Obba rivulosa]